MLDEPSFKIPLFHPPTALCTGKSPAVSSDARQCGHDCMGCHSAPTERPPRGGARPAYPKEVVARGPVRRCARVGVPHVITRQDTASECLVTPPLHLHLCIFVFYAERLALNSCRLNEPPFNPPQNFAPACTRRICRRQGRAPRQPHHHNKPPSSLSFLSALLVEFSLRVSNHLKSPAQNHHGGPQLGPQAFKLQGTHRVLGAGGKSHACGRLCQAARRSSQASQPALGHVFVLADISSSAVVARKPRWRSESKRYVLLVCATCSTC